MMILASKSPRRRELLEEAGYTFTCLTSEFDESSVAADDPRELPELLARGKALAVAEQAGADELVIGSDTIVLLGDEVLGKPCDEQDARRMLEALSGATHEVLTGVVVLRGTKVIRSFTETARVTFWPLSPQDIAWYLSTGEPFDKAGAYGIQGLGRLLVKSIEGDFYTVMGLPISRLHRELSGL